jgi:hypothetical protein
MKNTKTVGCLLVGFFVLFAVAIGTVEARMEIKRDHKTETAPKYYKLSSALPNAQQRVHRVGFLRLCVTNWGFLGSQLRELNESTGGCFNPHPDEEFPAPSCEYPYGSNIEYLFQGGLWIGAVVDSQYYTTVGCDGWFWIYEMWPDYGDAGAIKERSTRTNVACYSTDAVSEQDVISVYTDTSADIPLSPVQQDDWDNRKHFPLGLQVTQKSYSWSYEYAEDFVLVDFTIKNIGIHNIDSMYLGLYIDGDVMHVDESPYGPYGAQDDICGFKRVISNPQGACSDTVNLAWIADNDGHGVAGEVIFTSVSPTSVTGIRLVRSTNPGLKHSFNWWVSSQSGAPYDWGPWKAENQSRWAAMNPYGSGNLFPNGVLGTPGGDVSKYFIMSNGEFDYDQIFSCIWPDDHPSEGWLDPSPQCANLANGYDTRYLLSFGPFNQIAPGESSTITIGYVAGADFHTDPTNGNWLKTGQPDKFYAGLNFSDFETNAIWAAKMCDNPQPPDFPCGDGVPDFKGPPPPQSPTLSIETELCEAKIKWNGKIIERTRDSFSGRLDFEGYRVYLSQTGLSGDYALLGSYDRVDYKIYKLNRMKFPRVWEWKAASVTLDSLKSWLNSRGLAGMKIDDDPTIYSQSNPFVIKEVAQPFYIRLADSVDVITGHAVPYDSIRLESFDSLYFSAQDWNVGFDPIAAYPAYRDSVDLGLVSDTADRYYDYEYDILFSPGHPKHVAVTTFDMGDPWTNLAPLESSKLANDILIDPCSGVEEDEQDLASPGEYSLTQNHPNPFNPYTVIEYSLPKGAAVNLVIYNVLGQKVKTLVDEYQTAGHQAVDWDGTDEAGERSASGIYFYRLSIGDFSETRKMLLLK